MFIIAQMNPTKLYHDVAGRHDTVLLTIIKIKKELLISCRSTVKLRFDSSTTPEINHACNKKQTKIIT